MPSESSSSISPSSGLLNLRGKGEAKQASVAQKYVYSRHYHYPGQILDFLLLIIMVIYQIQLIIWVEKRRLSFRCKIVVFLRKRYTNVILTDYTWMRGVRASEFYIKTEDYLCRLNSIVWITYKYYHTQEEKKC